MKKTLILIAVLILAAVNCDNLSTGPEIPGKEVLYSWSEIEPLGGYFQLQLKGFKRDTVTAYVYSSAYDSSYMIYEDCVIPGHNVSQAIYIEVNFHYAQDLTLFLYCNRDLFAVTGCFPYN